MTIAITDMQHHAEEQHSTGNSRDTRPIAIGVELHRLIDIELVMQDQALGYRLTKRAFVEEAVRKYLDEVKLQRPSLERL